LTSEQLEASRAERLRLNGNGTLTLEDSRTWIEETGLCLFLPRRQFSAGVAPSFVEAVTGSRNPTPDPKDIALAEELLVRLENDGVAVRLNLLGQPGEQPDFVVAAWVLPYVYALRGDRDWRRSPQLTGSRQVSPLAIQAYKLLETGDQTIAQLKHTLGKEVTEAAVLRAITELWHQLRIIPVISAPGKAAQWQLLRHRFQKAIAEGASTSQVTAISVLASIYLQAVIAASMEDVELFLAPLTARSKVREVLRGLVATRQVHTISLGHAPHFYVAGTLPEFAVSPAIYASSAMAASAYFLHGRDFDDEPVTPKGAPAGAAKAQAASVSAAPISASPVSASSAETAALRNSAAHAGASNGKPSAARSHFSRTAARPRDRKPSQNSSGSRTARRPSRDARSSAARPASGSRHGSHTSNGTRWTGSSNGRSSNGNGRTGANGNGSRNGHGAKPVSNGAHTNGRNGKSAVAGKTHRNGKPAAKAGVTARSGSARKELRGGNRKPALTANAKAGNSKRYGFTAPAKRGTKKRG
jgi:23S rRNA pseudouridine2605 synthase